MLSYASFLRIINWSPGDKLVQWVRHKNTNDFIDRDCIELLTDFADLNRWIYTLPAWEYSAWEYSQKVNRIACRFPAYFRSRACLTMPSLSGITINRNRLGPFRIQLVISTQIISAPFFLVVSAQILSIFRHHNPQIIWTLWLYHCPSTLSTFKNATFSFAFCSGKT